MLMMSFRGIEKAATGFFWFENTARLRCDQYAEGCFGPAKKPVSGWEDWI